jgi:transcriptional regulator with XRE-family HTH domain
MNLPEMIAQRRGQLGMSQTDLAVDLCRSAGRDTITRTEVRKWETGKVTPGPFWLAHLADVLRLPLELLRLAKRPGTTGRVADFPLFPDGEAQASGDSVTSVIWDGGSEVERRLFLASSVSALAALALPDLEAVTRHARADAATVRVGNGEVMAVRRMTTVLADAASELGGGHARRLTVRYLAEDVAPWLNGTYTEQTGRELFAATSQLIHLAGWMAADEGKGDLAHKYYEQSHALAAEAGDAELAATALRGMAVGAIDLGHRAESVRYAQACIFTARHLDDPKATAYY